MTNSSPNCQAAEVQELRHQHAQLLEFNHMLVEESNQRLVEHAELVSEVRMPGAPLCWWPCPLAALSPVPLSTMIFLLDVMTHHWPTPCCSC